MKDYFKELPHDPVFDKFFNQTEGVAGLCREMLNPILSYSGVGYTEEKAEGCGYSATLFYGINYKFSYDTYYTKDGKPYAIKMHLNNMNKYDEHLYFEIRANDNGQLYVTSRFVNHAKHDDGNTMQYHENYEEIHFSDDLFMFDHSVVYQSFPTAMKTVEEEKEVRNGSAMTRDFNIVKQGHRITRYYDATKVFRDGIFPSQHLTTNSRAKLVEQLIEKLGKKQTSFYNEYEVVDKSMNFYVAKNRKLFDEFPRDARPFEDVVKYPKCDGALPINGMM